MVNPPLFQTVLYAYFTVNSQGAKKGGFKKDRIVLPFIQVEKLLANVRAAHHSSEPEKVRCGIDGCQFPRNNFP